jgi:hypothetical protein
LTEPRVGGRTAIAAFAAVKLDERHAMSGTARAAHRTRRAHEAARAQQRERGDECDGSTKRPMRPAFDDCLHDVLRSGSARLSKRVAGYDTAPQIFFARLFSVVCGGVHACLRDVANFLHCDLQQRNVRQGR